MSHKSSTRNPSFASGLLGLSSIVTIITLSLTPMLASYLEFLFSLHIPINNWREGPSICKHSTSYFLRLRSTPFDMKNLEHNSLTLEHEETWTIMMRVHVVCDELLHVHVILMSCPTLYCGMLIQNLHYFLSHDTSWHNLSLLSTIKWRAVLTCADRYFCTLKQQLCFVLFCFILTGFILLIIYFYSIF